MKNQREVEATVADVAVVGAGPAGLMAAIAAAEGGANVVVCEQLDRPGTRLLATGGGRCNLTNLLPLPEFLAAFGRGGRFLQPALALLDAGGLREFLDRLGVPTHAPDGLHVYPKSNRAADVCQALVRRCGELKVRLLTKTAVNGLWVKDGLGGIETSSGRIAARKVILAAGGKSYPKFGGTGGGYALAQQAGHTIIEPTPALVPLVAKETWPRVCAGVSVSRARVWVEAGKGRSPGARPGGVRPSAQGDILFTHTGISGPAVLDISGDVAVLLRQQPAVVVRLDLTPGTTAAHWLSRMDHWQTRAGNKPVRSLLAESLPASLAEAICGLAGIRRLRLDPELTAAHLSRPTREKLAGLLTALSLTITATGGFDEAMVTRGGVPLKEVDPRTLESRLPPGLFLAGEVLDLDGPCGGFNLQWAFASGLLAGRRAGRNL